ncbi:hypothetical protein KUA55_06095 [Enterococcus sp. ALS3]|uniref:Viral A-type inclusion protein n=1 Tax=Enterococcus alishanensis TaxID=1303817 RepID=A0ABS6TBG8_9ENTE|nr:hypothetical protein [Enterococcus alishanensis]
MKKLGGSTLTQNDNLQPDSSFDTVKESASDVLGGLMSKIQRLEKAMDEEDMGAVYQIYWQELPVSIQQSSNANHEIDNFLTSKIDREFIKTFPFMILRKKVSPVLMDYQISSYYHDRTVIEIDATQPEITVLPEIKQQWEQVETGFYENEIKRLQNKEDDFEAKKILATTEIKKLENLIDQINDEKEELEASKTFRNRKKIEEDLLDLDDKYDDLQAEIKKWQPYLTNENHSVNPTNELNQQIKALMLEQAIAIKELRLIKKYFNDVKNMEEQLQTFNQNFLKIGGE